MPRVGVLALQGAFQAHIDRLNGLDCDAVAVRMPAHLEGLDALVLPGGESTAISLLLGANGLTEPVEKLIKSGLPMFGTCAGMILLASEIWDGRPDQISFGALPIAVRRNGYGRQRSSFEADLVVDAAGIDSSQPFRAVFIRAPRVESVGPGVEILAEVDNDPVLVRSGSVWASCFHPELTPDDRLHLAFLASL